MRLIVAGGRDYELTPDDYARLDAIHAEHGITQILSGACPTGADPCGETWASWHDILLRRCPAPWHLGRRAGPLRNAFMASHADAVALFPGGRGTQSMHDEAVKAGLTIFDFRGQGSRER